MSIHGIKNIDPKFEQEMITASLLDGKPEMVEDPVSEVFSYDTPMEREFLVSGNGDCLVALTVKQLVTAARCVLTQMEELANSASPEIATLVIERVEDAQDCMDCITDTCENVLAEIPREGGCQ